MRDPMEKIENSSLEIHLDRVWFIGLHLQKIYNNFLVINQFDEDEDKKKKKKKEQKVNDCIVKI